ncbi:hypothetical protein E6O75_ATG02529 [Venturia nashicola]|uniref:Uncharacterized protein n=1 Tax=Venturia nashicola TaxID=86259 RepID=A0A4Z1PP31_9PEZI|nr:hypothetical protein E6O75_ATG02529 [Venturia nashicola]
MCNKPSSLFRRRSQIACQSELTTVLGATEISESIANVTSPIESQASPYQLTIERITIQHHSGRKSCQRLPKRQQYSNHIPSVK